MTSGLTELMGRLDFALITSMHIVYPPLTIGLSLLLFLGEWRWLRTGSEQWYRLTRFFEKLFIVNFGAGVATGVTMEFAFGTLFSAFTQAAGPVFGHVLGFETITAFMYEAGFVGLMIFGWHKIPRGVHLFATFNVALASALSAFWIMAANSWMQDPEGVALSGGHFIATDWGKVIFNADSITAIPHMVVASLELSLVFVLSVSAWQVLKARQTPIFVRALRFTVPLLMVVGAAQIWLGDSLGQTVARTQPAALAAMEGHYITDNPDGTPNTAWNLVMWPNKDGTAPAWPLSIPHVLSLLETHTWNGRVPGLDQVPKEHQPPVVVPFYSFRIMVAAGFALFALGLWGTWLLIRGRLKTAVIGGHTWFLTASVVAIVLPYAAILTGWWTRETARQPWIVYGLMTVSEGRSDMSLTAEILWLLTFAGFEAVVLAGTVWFLSKLIRRGPDMDLKIPDEDEEKHAAMGTLPPLPNQPAE